VELEKIEFQKYQSKEKAKAALIRLLQNAHAGEKAAANAYYGHANSLFIKSENERNEILKIYSEELHHRARLRVFLNQLHAQPRLLREIQMWLIGAVIALLSYFGTWLIPMYGAGKLERSNIGEYEVAARLALLADEQSLVDELLHFAEIEWDHEFYFRKKVETHKLYSWLPMWSYPKPRAEIRAAYQNFQVQADLTLTAPLTL
jgi:hypothetical protein